MDFSRALLAVVTLSGVAWLLEWKVLGPRRTPGTAAPWWVACSAGMFPVLALVLLVRSFVIEPFQIPSASMLPTLEPGDFIVVNKSGYGLRLPVSGWKLWSTGEPQRGDVIVFRYPHDPSVHYIKRLVGLPGDTVAYRDQQLFINGQQVVPTLQDGMRYHEVLGTRPHDILLDVTQAQPYRALWAFAHRDNCTYLPNSVTCVVPRGFYFGVGDNRDNSADSRYWGFIPAKNIEGRAFFIWLNLHHPGRIGPIT